MRHRWIGIAGAALALAGAARVSSQQSGPQSFAGMLDQHPAIQYALRPATDRVSALARKVADGTVTLERRDADGYLRSVLDALDVDPESQILVFSKTGTQGFLTSPRMPRAIYFDDSVAVGYIRGGPVLELAAHDPEQGVHFYTIEQSPSEKPAVVRGRNCVACHISRNTGSVPGMIVRSMFTSAEGTVINQLGSFLVDHRTPLPQRWGGFFVTGNYTAPPYDGVAHMGNVTMAMHREGRAAATSNEVFIQWINSAPETRGYLSKESDIAALMVFDHQMHAVNLLTRLNWESRVASASGRPDYTAGPLVELVAETVDYFLFVGEAPPPGPIVPRPGFAANFSKVGPRDRRARSLRELQLDTRLLRYPCSYMIYTAAFDHLPAAARQAVYARMQTVLTGGASAKYAHLSAADRVAILEILRDTKRDFPVN